MRLRELALDLLGIRRLTDSLNSTGSTQLAQLSQGSDVLPSSLDAVGIGGVV